MPQLNVFSSNRVETLYEGLKSTLLRKGFSPFTRRLIVVPSPAMKSWLLMQLASDPDCNVAAGFEVCYLDSALELIRRNALAVYADGKKSCDEQMPSEMELSLIFEMHMSRIISSSKKLNPEEREIWNPLLRHLKVSENGEITKKIQLRLIALCDRLATLFRKYGRHGCRMLDSWEGSLKANSWQEQLWKMVKKQHPHLCFSYQQLPQRLEEIKSNAIAFKNLHMHIFGLSFIPRQVHLFFAETAHYFPLNYYLLSPCQAFWSDICSDREKVKLQRYWEQKGISKPQQQALELFLRERNALLANFGRMGREMSIQIETSTNQIDECYQLTSAIQDHPSYIDQLSPDILLEQTESPLSILQAIQADMALLRNPLQTEKIELSENDHSIQLHVAYTKYREVEILYNTLLALLTRHADEIDPITPADIIVLVPDLAVYEALICSIFGAASSRLDFQILEMQQLAKSSLVQGFLHLLSLASSRWEAESVLQLLEYPEFQRKQGFSQNDLLQIRSWVQQSGTHWGQSAAHCNELLQGDHGDCQLVDSSPMGTWQHSASRLLMALAIEPSGLNDQAHPFVAPIDELDTTQIDLLGKWIDLLNTLQRDLKPLFTGGKMELLQWTTYLENLKDKYFQSDLTNKENTKFDLMLSSHLQVLSAAANFVKNERYSFDSVYFQLEKALLSESSPYREAHLQGVRFCSLLPMRAVPAKVVVLMGMEEGAFPRKEIPFSLDELISHSDADYCPTQTDFDRYLFLEALLSARRYFILSYVGYTFEGQRESAPSLVVQELLGYLDSGYQFVDKAPSEHCVHKHPFNSFDQTYFSENCIFPAYMPEHYLLAQAHYQKNKQNAHRFIADFSPTNAIGPLPSSLLTPVLTIKELAAFAANPLKAYFNKSLNMYLDMSERNPIQNEEPFFLTGLDKYQLRMEGVKIPTKHILDKATQKGKLPRGLFKIISAEGIAHEIEKMHLNFSQNQVDPLKIKPLTFTEHCEKAAFDEKNGWTLPPLHLNLNSHYPELKIIGTLKEVSPQGLIFHQKRDLTSIVKVWPQFLILCLAIKEYTLPIMPQLISSKDHKPFTFPQSEIEVHFANFIAYYFLSMQTPSPMIPEWIPDLLKADPEHFAKSIRTSLEGSFSSLYNDYALWVFRDKQQLPGSDELYRYWQPLSELLFSEVAQRLR